MENVINYTATQNENSFYVVFEDEKKKPVEITFDDFEMFTQKYNNSLMSGEQPDLSEKDQLMLSLWSMVMIPDSTIH